jgi:hypothetical protein
MDIIYRWLLDGKALFTKAHRPVKTLSKGLFALKAGRHGIKPLHIKT